MNKFISAFALYALFNQVSTSSILKPKTSPSIENEFKLPYKPIKKRRLNQSRKRKLGFKSDEPCFGYIE